MEPSESVQPRAVGVPAFPCVPVRSAKNHPGDELELAEGEWFRTGWRECFRADPADARAETDRAAVREPQVDPAAGRHREVGLRIRQRFPGDREGRGEARDTE